MGEARRRKLAGETEPKVKRGAKISKRPQGVVGSGGKMPLGLLMAMSMMMGKTPKLPKL